jgi:hypothetical protein
MYNRCRYDGLQILLIKLASTFEKLQPMIINTSRNWKTIRNIKRWNLKAALVENKQKKTLQRLSEKKEWQGLRSRSVIVNPHGMRSLAHRCFRRSESAFMSRFDAKELMIYCKFIRESFCILSYKLIRIALYWRWSCRILNFVWMWLWK